jgi:hypothetical protein
MTDWRGRKVVDPDGGKVGKLESVYLDRQTDTPKWGLVKTGLLGGRKLVPLSDASSAGDDLAVPTSKKSIKGAPKASSSEELSPEQEEELSRHYGLGGPNGGTAERGGHERERSSGNGAQPRGAEGSGEQGEEEVSTARSRERAARQGEREEFGGFKFGAALFGWVVAVVLTVILTAVAGVITGLIGLPSASSAGVAAIVSAVVLLIVLALAYYIGGYVAGRMARFNGPKQGLGVWVIGLAVALLTALAGVILGAQFNVLSQVGSLPSVPLTASSLTIGGVITLLVVLAGTLLAAMAGGKAGTRYHRRVDHAGEER